MGERLFLLSGDGLEELQGRRKLVSRLPGVRLFPVEGLGSEVMGCLSSQGVVVLILSDAMLKMSKMQFGVQWVQCCFTKHSFFSSVFLII
jgi:hypothetical protein